MIHIERVEVRGGFLDGLNVSFSDGLNVIMGARGTGKTSLIELIRFCFDGEFITESARTSGTQQALGVLQGGEVIATVNINGEHVEFIRSSNSRSVSVESYTEVPITVLAQNEVENIGKLQEGRLRLIDLFRSDVLSETREIEKARSSLRSIGAESYSLGFEMDRITSDLLALGDFEEELKSAIGEQNLAMKDVSASAADQDLMRDLQKSITDVTARAASLGATRITISDFAQRIRDLVDQAPVVTVDTQPESIRKDLVQVSEVLVAALEQLGQVSGRLDSSAESIGRVEESLANERVASESTARDLRIRLEQVRVGIGAISRKVDEIQERVGQAEALNEIIVARQNRFKDIKRRRDSANIHLETNLARRFVERTTVASELSTTLHPNITVEIFGSGQVQPYADALTKVMQGSGLQYATLVPRIAKSWSPVQLAELVEEKRIEEFSRILNIPPDRASRLITHLNSQDLGSVLASPIEDDVILKLKDGEELKSSELLSIGQRCTVVLPILFATRSNVILVDQPEDHLDNSFIAKTLVEAIKERRSHGQMILASHNANIPVLGFAEHVIHLISDGQRAEVSHAGGLSDPTIVEAITDIMEGGKEAFEARAKFYGASWE